MFSNYAVASLWQCRIGRYAHQAAKRGEKGQGFRDGNFSNSAGVIFRRYQWAVASVQ
jgi:hypothetical protein